MASNSGKYLDKRSLEQIANDADIKVVTAEQLEGRVKCDFGGYSSIYKVTLAELGPVVYKKIEILRHIDDEHEDDVRRMTDEQMKEKRKAKVSMQFDHEFRLHSQFKHNNVVKLLGAILQPCESLGMLLEVAERGSVRGFLGVYRNYINRAFRVKLLSEAASAVEYLHQLSPPVVHGDLKSDNLLVTNKFMVKLCDFGSAAVEGVDYGRLMPFTYQFRPPEAWEQNKEYKPKTTFDVYSFAIVMLEVMSGEIPYEDLEAEMVEWHVSVQGNRFPLDELNAPPEIISLIEECWQQDPYQRPCFRDITTRLGAVRRFCW